MNKATQCYIATGLPNHAKHNEVRDRLAEHNITLTYDWTVHGSVAAESVEKKQETAVAEMNGVATADFVIVLLPGKRGTHAELGASEILNHDIYLYDPEGEVAKGMLGEHTCVFYYHPLVQVFEDLDLLIAAVLDDWGALEEEDLAAINLMDYVAQVTESSFCPDCDEPVILLSPKQENVINPVAYYTHHCGYLGRVGDKRLR